MKTEIKITALESKVLNWLKNEGWYNYDNEPFYSDVEAKDIAGCTEIDIQSLKGVLGSLSKKDLISIDEYEANFNAPMYFIVATENAYIQLGDEKLFRELGY